MKRLTAALALLAALGCAATASADTGDFIHDNYNKQRVVPYAAIPDGKITVDGDLSDWSDVPVRDGVIDDVLDHTVGKLNGNVRGAATFRFAHDSQAFYVAVQVADLSIVPSRTDNIYEGDAVEFFLDFRPLAGAPDAKNHLGDSAYTDGTAQIMVAAPVDGQPLRQKLGALGGAPLGPYDVAAKPCPGGYCVELRIPFTSIPGDVPGRMTQAIGFDVSIDDVDATTDGVSGRRSFAWSGNSNQWQDASSFGLADPKFDNSRIPAPLQRTAPAVYVRRGDAGLDRKGHVLVAGDVAPIGTPESQTGYNVHFDDNVAFGDAHGETTAYPELGVQIRRTWWPADNLATGKYKATTDYVAGLRQAVRFDAVGTASSKTLAVKSYPAGTSTPDKVANGAYLLPNGIRISPVGRQIPLPGDMPQSFVWLDKTHLAVNTGGYHDQGVDVIDAAADKVVQTVPVYQTFGSMSASGKSLYLPGGHAASSARSDVPGSTVFKHAYRILEWNGSTLTQRIDAAIRPVLKSSTYSPMTDPDVYVAGIAADEDTGAYAVNINADKLYKLGGQITPGSNEYVLEAYTGTGYRPYAIALAPDKRSIAVANWGDESVTVYDSTSLAEVKSYKVGSHPVALAYAHGIGLTGGPAFGSFKSDSRLFVACSGSNEVDAIDNGQVTETIKTSLDPRDIVGSTPDALAVSPDGKRLYVANADNNDVCVVDISEPGESRVVGFIPTGWYPSAITVSPDGKKLYIGIGKGLSFSANPNGKYIAGILNGAVSVVDVPSAAQLAKFTRQVALDNAPSTPGAMPAALGRHADAVRLSSTPVRNLRGKIKHIVYIIRENRTYDQVLGDDARGNGDPNIVMFGKDVTPNAHKLADSYVLLDNLYCSGEVSENGHQWCDSAYATDFVQRAWPQSYSGKSEPDADDRLTASPAGYLWDNCARHGVSYYAYGEAASFTATPDRAPTFTGEGTLKGHANVRYGEDYWNKRDTVIDQYFISDLHKAEKTGSWPNFMIMSLPEDHTHGLGAGSYTPSACVASNDLAVGQIVDAVSHSKFWQSTAIFIIEDDAQDGPDHVDAHRTVGLVISPYIKHGYVDHTLYTTASYVRTIEDILGLPYMTQFDENATPLTASFDTIPVLTAYAAVPPKIDVMAKNQAGPAAVESAKLDFSAPDRIDPATYNRLLWQAIKPGVPMPAPVRRGLVAAR